MPTVCCPKTRSRRVQVPDDNLHDVIVFVDIGGNRLLRDLKRLLQRLINTPALRPAQVPLSTLTHL